MLKFRFTKARLSALFFLLSGFTLAQKPFMVLYSEIHSIPNDSGFTVYYSYRIPYSNLVFEKNGGIYSADFRILVEVTDSSKKFITRQLTEKNVNAKDFEQTNSKEIFYEGLLIFRLSPLTYFLNPVFTDINSGREINLDPLYLPLIHQQNFLKAIIASSEEFSCNEESFKALVNFNDNLPFGETAHEFILPAADTSISKLYVLIVNNGDTVYNGSTAEQVYLNPDFFECGGRILISRRDETGSDKPLKLFTLKNITQDLYEGILTIFVSDGSFVKDSKPVRVYNGKVEWYNKPLSLRNPETAIKMLKYIESDSLISALLSKKDEEYPKLLFEYWKKYDPTPQTAFNPLMLEYYQRVDYAQKNFSTITGTRGIDSDRGMIFIKFGKPTKIERTSDEYGKIVETWSYEKLGKKFIFVDRQGTGEFLLRNG